MGNRNSKITHSQLRSEWIKRMTSHDTCEHNPSTYVSILLTTYTSACISYICICRLIYVYATSFVGYPIHVSLFNLLVIKLNPDLLRYCIPLRILSIYPSVSVEMYIHIQFHSYIATYLQGDGMHMSTWQPPDHGIFTWELCIDI